MTPIILTLIGSTICFVAALKTYLNVATKFPVPLSNKDSGTIMIMWLLLSIVMIATFGIPAKVIEAYGDPIPRACGILPLLVGAGITALFFKEDWMRFLQRFHSGGTRKP